MNPILKSVRRWMIFFMVSLLISGLTAIPAETELRWVETWFTPDTTMGEWLRRVSQGVAETNQKFPFIAYGYDWLAFAHIVLAFLFVGPLKDPVRNKWVIRFGQYCCLFVIPFAFAMGAIRGIPIGWRLIDCSFGVIGLIPLTIVYRKIERLELHRSLVTVAL